MKEYTAIVIENKRIAENINSLTLKLPESVKIRAGQFVNISIGGKHLLRRPIAISESCNNIIKVCFQIKGDGTKALSLMSTGMSLNVLLPLGNGFYVAENEKKIALVGGGVGIFPMISVIGEYGKKKNITAYVGFRNKDAVCGLEQFEKADRLIAVTDDGSFGEKMNSVQALERDLKNGNIPDVILSCGPTPMLRALKNLLENYEIPAYVSLEERMGCGIGACLVCVCNLTNGKHARVCKDGPVFNIKEVEL